MLGFVSVLAEAEVAPRPAALIAFNAANDRLAAEDENVFARNGLVADRHSGEVHILAQTTGMTRSDPVEFLMVSPKSGHEYEALSVAFCAPGAVYEALAFLGLKPGRPLDPKALVFWPKGERIQIEVSCRDTNLWTGRIPAENLIRNAKADAAMEASGFVFSGSSWVERDGERAYLPDISEPHAIATLYNEPATVLDVPRQAGQNALYDTLFPNPDYNASTNLLLDFYLIPEPGRNMDLNVVVVPAGTNLSSIGDLSFNLSGSPNVEPIVAPLAGLIEQFANLAGKGKDPFVSLRFSETVPIDLVRQVCLVLSEIEGESGIRMEPPPNGQLYYKAFLPEERHRKREDRVSQPWELRLYPSGSTNVNVLTQIKETWADGQMRPTLEPVDHPIETPGNLRSKLDELGPGLPVILVFVPPELTHETLLRFLTPVLKTHGVVHVYLEK
jgi:hypothetical protein